MKHDAKRKLLAGVLATALLLSCMLSGVVLPVSADADTPTRLSLSQATLWLLSGREHPLEKATITYADGTTATCNAADLTWTVADDEVATVEGGVLSALTEGTTTATATIPNVTDAEGNPITAVCQLNIIDGSNYVYSNPQYTYGAELITNGDFEQGAGTGWKSTAPIEADAGETGNGMVLNKSTTQYYQGSFSNKILPGNTYEIKFDYKASTGSSFYVWSSTLGSSNLSVKPTLNSTDDGNTWKTYTYVFTQPAGLFLNANYDLGIVSAAANATYPVVIDNLSIRELQSTVTVESVKLTYDRLTLQPGSTFQLKAQSTPYEKYLNDLTWTSSNPAVAVVNYGRVAAVSAGSATITVTTPNGKTASCVVTVTPSASLIANGTFENTASTAWTYSTTSSAYAANTGYYRSTAAKVAKGNNVQQVFTGLEPNATYAISGFIRQKTPKKVQVTVTNGETVLLDSSQTPTAYGKAFNLTFTTPETLTEATSTLTLTTNNVTSATTAYLDNIVLVKTSDVDLIVESVAWDGDNGEGQVNPGTPITFKAIIKNQGTADIPAGQAFTIDIASNGTLLRTLTYAGGVAAGATVTVTDTEAWTAVAGDHMISARVNASLSVYETNTATNNTHQLNLRVANDRLAPTYDAVANAVEQAGMDRLTMSDDFNSLDTVDMTAGGKEGYKWYVTRYNNQPTLTPHDYRIDHTEDGNGILTLMNEVNAYNITFSSADVNTNNGFLFKQGYLEVKFRIVRPDWYAEDKGSPAIWSFTENVALSGKGDSSHWVELDWMEYWGVSGNYPNGYYTVTAHDTTRNSNYSNTNYSQHGLGDAEWHVMGWLWEHNSIRTFIDGVEVMYLFFDENMPAVPGQRPNTDYTVVGSSSDPGIFSLANEYASILYLGGSKDNPMEVDYVRIWQTSEPAIVSNNMTLDRTDVTMWEHGRQRLTVSVPEGEDAGTLTWTSSDPTVATIHGNGEVYAQGPGSAVITATNANGTSVQCTVTVQHNVMVGGDFEWEIDPSLDPHWNTVITATSGCAIEQDTDDPNNHYLTFQPSTGVKYYRRLGVQKGLTYRLTGRYKGTTNMRMYFTSARVTAVDDLNSSTDTITTRGWRNLKGVAIGDTGWKQFDVLITITTGTLNNGNDVLGFSNNSSTNVLYVDDLIMTEYVVEE